MCSAPLSSSAVCGCSPPSGTRSVETFASLAASVKLTARSASRIEKAVLGMKVLRIKCISFYDETGVEFLRCFLLRDDKSFRVVYARYGRLRGEQWQSQPVH